MTCFVIKLNLQYVLFVGKTAFGFMAILISILHLVSGDICDLVFYSVVKAVMLYLSLMLFFIFWILLRSDS